MGWGFHPYVSAADKRARSAAALAKLKAGGLRPEPVAITGKQLATTFWGKAWNDNLERYRDFAHRLERGRTYARNGSVVHLGIEPRGIRAYVSGSELYTVTIDIAGVPAKQWRALAADVSSGIGSLVELLQGRFGAGVIERLCRMGDGLFPIPDDIEFACSCPDAASLCKHVAAALYGVGARLDAKPELLFALRGVDPQELLAGASKQLSVLPPIAPSRALPASALGIFELDLAPAPEPIPSKKRKSGRAKSAR